MITTKKADKLYNANPFTWRFAKGEILELVEEIKKFNIEGIREELADAIYATSCAFYASTGVNIPIIMGEKSVSKIENRFVIWREIFKNEGLVFDKKYLINGANYEKEIKVKMAIELAKEDQLTIQ